MIMVPKGNNSNPAEAAQMATASSTMAAFDDESVAMVSQQRFQSAIGELLRAEPKLQRHPAVQQAQELNDWALVAPISKTQNKKKNKTKTKTSDDDVARAYLNAMASCLVHEEFLWVILKHLRAFCLDLMARLMDGTTLTLYDDHHEDQGFTICSDNLTRRERIAGALVTLLAFLPQTKHLVLQYFIESPCFFEYVTVAATQTTQSHQQQQNKNKKSNTQHATPIVRARLRRIVQIAYRLLQLYPHEVTPIWNWASVYPLCFHEDLRVRWYAARATALVLRMSNTQRNAFLHELRIGLDAAVGSHHSVVVRQIEINEHRFEIAQQQQRVELVMSEPHAIGDDHASLEPIPFHESLTNVFGVVIPTKRSARTDVSSFSSSDVDAVSDPLVPTPSTKRNLQALAIALGLKRPVLIAGPGGCGKTAVIRELARVSGNSDMVELHLDDQIDSKTLLGSYVCTDIPGEFTWQPGALTTAVLNGCWVVIEDIDRAPFEVLAALMPLLETREMVLPGRGELLVAHSNFQIFATTSHGHNMPKGFQESIWARVDVQSLHDTEVENNLTETFPRIPAHVVAKIMTTFNVVCGHDHVSASTTAIWKESRRNYGRDFSLRDLLKWSKRIYAFCYSSNSNSTTNASSPDAYITEEERLRIIVEACDVFCAGIRDPHTRVQAAVSIGAIWQAQDEKVRYMMEHHKPTVKFSTHEVEIGRVHLPTMTNNDDGSSSAPTSFVNTGHVLRLLEKLAAIIHTCEPALLIGETGCGKTTVIQHLAASMGQKLVVQNLNIQSDSSDLVGGFKPVELHLLVRPLYMSFVDLFSATFSQKSNAAFLNVVRVAFEHKDWKKMAKGMRKALQMANAKLNSGDDREEKNDGSAQGSKMVTKGASPTVMKARWETFDAEVSRFERQKEQVESHFAFAFVEGVLVKALREGHWVLLDEINLASSDTLERISTLLEYEKSAFSLTERGDVEIIKPHPNFRLFGAMNPSTDVGKKDLPPSLRNRFTEIYVDECVAPTDLQMVVQHHFKEIASAPVMETVGFYLEARKQAEERLSDGARHRPRYSLRTLTQALSITRILIQRGYGMARALYEGFSSTFCTLLDLDSRAYLQALIKNTFAKTMKARDLNREPPCPGGQKRINDFVVVSSYWVRKGDFMEPRDDSLPDPVTCRKKFVLTKSVDENLRHVARAALIGKYPVLLQGPTSAGKTSLIAYLAARIGQKCVRINNHEHTDIQEYLGSYVSDSNGKLAFKEGVLVEAVRNGWWIILDELNLAPSEVLEALNRLLDDNRELFLPETQETVKPHPKFMLFATQNPPGLYGGRKVLSRAFRNRFLEIQVDEVPTKELQTILQERSSLPPSYCGILIDIMRQLQMVRQQSSIFAGKSGFITTRDLLRWAERGPSTKQALAEEGYCLLAERLRKDEEKQVVKQVIEQKCNVTIDLDAMYYRGEVRESNLLNEDGEVEHETVWGSNEQFMRVQQLVEQALESGENKSEGNAAGLDKISVTKALRRLFALVGRCLQNEEPVLLVGETGCGKTTVCQLYSLLFNQPLHIINCHQHTETSDFLGCLRPVRGKEKIAGDLLSALVAFLSTQDIEDVETKSMADLLALYERVSEAIAKKNKAKSKAEDVEMDGEDAELLASLEKIDHLKRRYQSIFEWCDGPLVESMKKGDLILVDEVNLAEDAVLERLNSVLEPSRTLLLAEKGGDQVEEIVAHGKWRIMATMNPGGDFGKRELSPALRNRFTEIWVPAISDLADIATIIGDRLVGRANSLTKPSTMDLDLGVLCDPILAFVKKFNEKNGGIAGCGAVTLRDILSWINFICAVIKKQQSDGSRNRVSTWTAFVQGAALSILDGLGLGSDKALHTALKARDEAYEYLLDLVPRDDVGAREEVLQSLHATKQAVDDRIAGLNSADESHFGIAPFVIKRGPDALNGKDPSFSLKAPTTMSNLYRVLRAMQVNRPIILEGSPGVGKTSLVSALAAASGHRLVRINLSEQTDISDLFGSDLPAAASSSGGSSSENNSNKGMFEWCDGVFLRALKAGDWVLLDELNLASQSVLEGLNSCLDHRGTVYIPELDREFECPPTFRVFAAQNPLRQGGGRKGLPKSFLNRFTRVFVDTLHEQDLTYIATSMYPQLNVPTPVAEQETTISINSSVVVDAKATILERMIKFNSQIHKDTMDDCKYGRLGAPWEFNLRDVFRFCELLNQDGDLASAGKNDRQILDALRYYVNFIYVERMRSPRDRAFVAKRFAEFFGDALPLEINNVALRVGESFVQIGRAFLSRREDQLRVSRVAPPVFNFLLKPMEALVHCVNLNWPALLVGGPGSGKTSAVRLLAALSGNKLHELGMSAGTDATELLGCFEQVDLGRKLREIQDDVREIFDVVIEGLLRKAAATSTTDAKRGVALTKQARQLSNQWFALVQHERDASENNVGTGSGNNKKKRAQLTKGELDGTIVDSLTTIVTALTKAVPTACGSANEDAERLVAELQRLEQRTRDVVQLSKASAASVASSFEWVDGTLIQAMERGEWILLDNVNFCSSSVLDRLNSLMETGGELLINECGVINGKLRVVKPHPAFRVFLAMDAQFGEVSRAMRNRCVEIALVDTPADQQPRDLVVMATAAGVPGFELGRGFERVHRTVEAALSRHAATGARVLGRFSRRHLENWAMLASREMERGVAMRVAVDRAFERVYASGEDLLKFMELDKDALLESAFTFASDNDNAVAGVRGALALPPSTTLELCQRAESVMIKRDFAYVDYLLRASAQQAASNVVDDQLFGTLSSSVLQPPFSSSTVEKPADLELVDFVEFASEQRRLDLVVPREELLTVARQHLTSIEFFPFGGASLSVLLAPFALRRLVQSLSSGSSRIVTEEGLLFAMETIVSSFPSRSAVGSEHAPAYLLFRFLRSLLSNKLYKTCATQVRATLQTLLETVGACTTSEQFPVYLSANAAAFHHLETLVASHRTAFPQVDALWVTLVGLQSQLELLDGTEWLRFCEEEQFEQIDALLAPNSHANGTTESERSAKRVKKQAAFDGDLSGFSVLQQSYAVHQYHADRSSIVNGDVVFLIFPFFKAFDTWLATVVERTTTSTTEEWCASSLKRLVQDRFELSIQLRESALDWTHFLIHWQIVKKSLVHQDVAPSSTTEWGVVLDMHERINAAIEKVVGCASHKNTLWKRGGHAFLPRSAELWNAKYLLEKLAKTHMQLDAQCFGTASMASNGGAQQQVDVLALLFGGVAGMEAAMKSGRLDVSSLFYVDATSRREVLHALCAFSFLSKQQQQHTQKTQSSENKDLLMAEELLKVPDVLLQKLQQSLTETTALISSKTLYLSELEDTSANQHLIDFITSENAEELGGRVGRDAPILLFDMKESAALVDQLVNFQLAPLKEHALARQEVEIVGKLVHIVNVAQWTLSSSNGDDVDMDVEKDTSRLVRLIQEALHDMESLLDAHVEMGLRNPATFHAYQDIVWCGHRFTASNNSDALLQDNEAFAVELRGFVELLASQLSSVLCGFHQFLRENSFNAMESVALEIYDTQNKRKQQRKNRALKKNGDGDDADDDVAIHHRVIHGLPRVFQSVGSAVVLRCIAEVDLHASKCATIETQVRMLRMQKIKDHLRSLEVNRSSAMGQGEDSGVPRATFTLLQELFIFTITAFQSSFQQDGDMQRVLGEWLMTGERVSSESRTLLLRVLRSSRDVRFAGLVDAFVVPLLDVLAMANDQKDTSPLLSLGEGLVLLGLWRFLLLLPSSPVDPVTKPLVKKEMLMNRVAMHGIQAAVDGAIQRLAPQPEATQLDDKSAEEVKALAEQVRHVSAFAIQRFNPETSANDATAVRASVFGELFRDLLRFQKTIMPAEKLLAFVAVVRTSIAKGGHAKCRQVLRELDMFQQTTDNFVAQISKKFGSSFYDIVEPLAASIGAVKEGVAMLAAQIHYHLQHASVEDDDKNAVALALLRFPRTPASTTADSGVSSRDEVFNLIRLVGSKVSALAAASSKSLVSKKATDVALLNVALRKMAQQFKETLVQAASLSSSSFLASLDADESAEAVLRSSKSIFDLFLAKWQEQKQRAEEKRIEEEALFKYRTREVEIESEDQLLEQEYRQQFPDYTSKEFSAFLTPEHAARAAAMESDAASGGVEDEIWISDSLIQELCDMHTHLYAASSSGVPSFNRKELIDAFARAFSLAVNMRRTINAMQGSPAVEHAAVGASLFAASLVESRLHVGQAPPMSMLNSEYIRGVDFHRDPLVKEAVLAAQPLQNLLVKVQKLLALWPEHAILQQIVLIADRIRNFEISSPLVRTLTAIELLVRKAQEWESYAAREFSIADDLRALSSLITRWRKLELYSWPHLLHVKEKQHRAVAHKTWFHMYSLLTAQFEGDASAMEMMVSETLQPKKELQWLYLNDMTTWVFGSGAKSSVADASGAAVVAVSDAQKKWRSDLFATLDAYMRSCPMGQYESRLLIVYAFCCQLFMEYYNDAACEQDAQAKAAKYGLANVLYHLYRYYAQHLAFLDRQWSGMRAPIQRKLLEFVKICKWDEQTYYSLEESAEKSHRKLMKFVRDYDAVLTVNMQTVIDASSDNGITKDGGFVGIVATKTELDRFEDSVYIPRIELIKPVVAAPVEEEGEGNADEEPVLDSDGKPVTKKQQSPPAKPVVVQEEPTGSPTSAGIFVVVAHNTASLPAMVSVVGEEEANASLSTYASKLPGFAKRIGKYTKLQILAPEQVKQRQLSREICEDLCTTIFYRMALLQNDGRIKDGPKLPKGAKKKALIDLLAELKAQGLSYHRMQLPQEQQQMEQLFALDVPDVENCIQVDGLNDLAVIHEEEMDEEDAALLATSGKRGGKKKTKAKKTTKLSKKNKQKKALLKSGAVVAETKDTPLWLWRRADDYYYRFVSQLASLRFSSMMQFSHDLSASEVDRMNGYAENMLFRMLQQRQLLHASALSHEHLLLALQRVRELHTWSETYLTASEAEETTDDVSVEVAIQWQQHQQRIAAQLREPLRELEVVVSQVLSTSSSRATATTPVMAPVVAQAKFDAMLALVEDVTQSFESRDLESGRVLRKSMGAPGIPFHASLSSDDHERDGNAGLVAFAHPQKRGHGVSPLVALEASVVLPASPSVLRSNSNKLEKIRDSLLETKAAFALVAPTAPFDGVVNALESAMSQEESYQSESTAAKSNASRTEQEEILAAATQSKEQFAEHYDKLVSTVLVAIQELTKSDNADETPEDEEDEQPEVSLREQLSSLTSSVKNARIHPIATQLHAVLDLVAKQYSAFLETSCASTHWRNALHESLRLLAAIEPIVVDLRGISRQLLTDLLVTHKSVVKLDYILVRIFRNLFQHGFCRTEDDKEDGDEGGGDGKTKFTDDVDGTGMGEGEGKKDVSDQIEDEEQLLGLKGDQDEQKPPEDGEKPEDTGLEMQNDFDGTMHDVPDDEKDENDDDKNSDDEEELDREMGDFDQDDENVVDEKKWGDDSDDDEDDIDKENEKFEDDSRMDQSEAIEDEIRGKDDNDDDDDQKKKQDKEEDKASKEKDMSQDPNKDDDGAGDDSDEDGEGDGDDADGEEEDEDKKDPVNDDLEDNYEEKHDHVDPNSRDGDQEEEEKPQEGDDLPENMQLDGDDEDDGGDEEGGDDGDEPDESMDPEGDETHGDEAEDKDDDEQKEDEENEEPLDNAVQLGAGGLDDDVDTPEDEETPEPEKDETKTEDDASDQQKSSSAVAGTQSKDGVDELDQEESAQDEAMEDDPSKQDENDTAEENENQQKTSSTSQSSNEKDDKQDWRPQSQLDQPKENEEQKRNRRKQEPNPYRNPQTAQEHWKRRVDMIKRDNKDEDTENDKSKQPDGGEDREMTTAELLDDDEEMEDAQHALAPAEENQIMNQQNKQNDDDDVEDESKKEQQEDDHVDGAGASAMEMDEEDVKKEEDDDETKIKPEEKTPKPERDHATDKDKVFDADPDSDEPKPEEALPTEGNKEEDDDVDMDESNASGVDLRQPGDQQDKRTLGEEEDEEDEDEIPMPKLLTPEEVAALREDLDLSIANWSHQDEAARGAELWQKYAAITMGSSQRLCEQLRLVLEPMLRAKLEGDFRTGKRINMRKVIPYIASQFRKDKIWMRRTRPSKRAYQIMVAIDDSESMADNHAGRLALEAMTTLCKALTQLEVGEISVVKFGQDIELLHAFDSPFTDDAGSRVITQFGFQQKKTNMITTLDAILQVLETAKQTSQAAAANSNVEFTQIVFLISDGRFDTDGRTRIKKLVEKALEQQQLIVLLVVDHAENADNSIVETKSVTFSKGKVEMVPYLENYPFPYYVILPTSVLLPEILSDSLRQWFEMLQMKQ